MDITTECLRAVDLGEQSASWSLDTLTTFSVTNKYAREYVIGAYMHHNPRADVAKVAEACGLTWSVAGTRPRCKSLENYKKFYTTVGETAEGLAIPLADALATFARDRALERSTARKATAARVRELIAQQPPAPEPTPEPTEPTESAFPEPVDLITGEPTPIPAAEQERTVPVPVWLLEAIRTALDEADRPALVAMLDDYMPVNA